MADPIALNIIIARGITLGAFREAFIRGLGELESRLGEYGRFTDMAITHDPDGKTVIITLEGQDNRGFANDRKLV